MRGKPRVNLNLPSLFPLPSLSAASIKQSSVEGGHEMTLNFSRTNNLCFQNPFFLPYTRPISLSHTHFLFLSLSLSLVITIQPFTRTRYPRHKIASHLRRKGNFPCYLSFPLGPLGLYRSAAIITLSFN